MKIKPSEFEPECIVFPAVQDDDGVLDIPEEMADLANEIAESIDNEIEYVEGNYDDVRFYFVEPLSEEVCEQLSDEWL
jgi:hypothetical protein